MDDGILGVLQFAIDGTSSQQQATANNIANVDTPNFTGSTVSFEQSLQTAIDAPGQATAEVTTSASPSAPATNGNNVEMGSELVDATSEQLHYSALSESINSQFRLISGVSGGTFQ